MLNLKSLVKVGKSAQTCLLSKNSFGANKFFVSRRFFTQTETKREKYSANDEQYKQEFENLKEKISSKNSNEKVNDKTFESIKNLKENLFSNLKYGKNVQEDPIAKQVKEEQAKTTKDAENTTDKATSEDATESQEETKTSTDDINKEAKEEKVTWRDSLRQKVPVAGKVVDFCSDAWEETFPSETYERKKEVLRKKAKELAKQRAEEETREYTEEELEKMQENIPDWKRTSLITTEEAAIEEKPSMIGQLKNKVVNRINQTTVAQKVYGSNEYKEYDEFRKEMTQFKADLKDHMHQSQNPLVQGSVGLYDKVKSESNTAKSINEMRKIDPSFDIYDLERDAKGIFIDVYSAYLQGDLERIEKQCGDMALGYFRVLLKKREADKVEPKFKELLEIRDADLVGGQVPDNKYPMFTFTVRTQEIYCNVSLKDKKIVEGAEDRIMHCQYNFVLTPHQNPDLEEIGHNWELVELAQVGNMIALV